MKHLTPQWLDGSHMDPEWIEKATGISCKSCEAVDISNEGRKSQGDVKDGATLRLTLELSSNNDDEPIITLIVKQFTQSQGLGLSKHLGLAREALFYSQLWSQQQDHDGLLPPNMMIPLPPNLIPKIHYSYGNFETGEKVVIMEDLDNAIDSGVLFGPGNPNNWKRDLPSIAAKAPGNPTSKEVAMITFCEMAKVHATCWKSNSLLSIDKSWLRGQNWLQGQGQESWKASQGMLQNWWTNYLTNKNEEDLQPVIAWDPNVRKAVEKAIQGISWEAQLERLHTNGHWTLVHGDFWPGNIMWMCHSHQEANQKIKIIDWEMVGLGSGPQELGQYVISNMDPAERRDCEKELVEAYYKVLKEHLNDDCSIDISWEYCWSEYKVGGVERWLWFLVYFIGNGMADWAQYFHDQISEFMIDHNLSANDITQPRP